MDEYNFWVIFQQFKKKKKILLKKCKNGFGLLPKLYCEFVLQALQLYCKRESWKNCRKKKLYCNTIFVLQRGRLEGWKVYCSTLYCIAEKEWAAGKLYCKRLVRPRDCISGIV